MIMSRKKKFKRILLCALLISLPLIQSYTEKKNDNIEMAKMCINNNTVKLDSIKSKKLYKINQKDSIKNELIDEVERYIFENYPETDKNIPTLIVNHGLEHNVDILFMMAQTQQETCYGTLGAGRKSSRRSLFGVAVRRYNNYENAVADYVKILKKSYLTNGRTEQHLLQRYVTSKGSRYAADRRYEITLKKTYNNISKQTKIKELQNKYIES